ncbi:MAG: L-fucose/L-arabinose isomerase family protein [Candidatus Marinimicrobia bacterium]|nr:L-fucose/L-arabinose isomerase family protein [Candidatus Neomarinimicrobiota bacterium]MCF7827864.1 L-fucose/L-arabinose isomerase family protein [Candidatus Neomarinimicrobiota bacterium]MCF7879381.1 L-fucose/L-arabinose isomerase family protein [Candidatus Neomarinimicrobiota bacterium]
MPQIAKPKIGLLGIMQELYDDTLPNITEHQEAYAREVIDQLSDVVEIDFPKAARNRADIEEVVGGFNAKGLDGIMIVMLTYGPGLRTVRALQQNQLPLMLANIQPVPRVTDDWNMDDLTYNQGVHGAQDMANMILRTTGKPATVISDDWKSDRFKDFVDDWAHAAQTASRMKRMHLLMVEQMPGMGDILADPAAMMRKLGPQVDIRGIGLIHEKMESATDEEVQASIAKDHENFEVDSDITDKQHEYAARFEVGIRKFLEENRYEGFSIYFDAPGNDGRFDQIHMLAASNLMADGYGYAAEGDMNTVALTAAGHSLAGDAHFTEMYAMDFEKDTALQSHMGEGNWKIARTDEPVQLIDRPLGIGALDNPPTVLFRGQPGPATLATLVYIQGEEYRLVVSQGEIMDTEVLPTVEMPYFHFKPNSGVRACLDGWLENGGTHHQCLLLGDQRRRWQMWCKILDVDYVEV